MKLIYGTNIWSHHQIPIATELAKLLGPEQFKMALFEEVHDERRKMGWAEREELPWVIGPPRDSTEMQTLLKECIDADVMVVGACPREVMEARIATGKLTLVAAERILKKPFHHLRMLNPRYATGIRKYRTLVNHPHVYALAIGHYAPDDLRTIGAFADRILEWGYFIDTPANLPAPLPERFCKLLWVGRVLDWKRVDLLLKALYKLRDTGCIGECLIVGEGPERQCLLDLARRLHLSPDFVQFLPSVPFSEVRRLMREADVYVLTSNRHEGWGAVAGEAMVEGCVLVANEAAGAAQVLVRDGETGLLFRDGDVEQLAGQLKKLASDYSLRMRLRKHAWDQMQNIWHPRVAAERLVALCKGLLGHSELPSFTSGPCSKATEIFTQRI
jgi:glycosyltransferase involved in cell wall biosynthesis